MCSRVVITPVLQELKEFFRATFLKETHQWALDSLHLRTRDFGDLAITVHEAACDLLELEITSDVCMHEDLGEFTRGDDKLGYEIDGVVSVATELLRGCLVGAEFTVQLGCEGRSGGRR